MFLSAPSIVPAHAETHESLNIDINAVEAHFVGSGPTINLHSLASAFPDGVKGARFESVGTQVGLPLNIPADFSSMKDYRAWRTFCNFDTIILAKFLHSTSPLITSDKSEIYTVSYFSVLDVIKGDGFLTSGQTVITYRRGGEVTDAGERLRVDVPDAPPYRANNTYILQLRREKNASKLQYAALDEGTIQVTNQRIYSNLGEWSIFLPGTSYREVVSTFNRVSNARSCN